MMLPTTSELLQSPAFQQIIDAFAKRVSEMSPAGATPLPGPDAPPKPDEGKEKGKAGGGPIGRAIAEFMKARDSEASADADKPMSITDEIRESTRRQRDHENRARAAREKVREVGESMESLERPKSKSARMPDKEILSRVGLAFLANMLDRSGSMPGTAGLNAFTALHRAEIDQQNQDEQLAYNDRLQRYMTMMGISKDDAAVYLQMAQQERQNQSQLTQMQRLENQREQAEARNRMAGSKLLLKTLEKSLDPEDVMAAVALLPPEMRESVSMEDIQLAQEAVAARARRVREDAMAKMSKDLFKSISAYAQNLGVPLTNEQLRELRGIVEPLAERLDMDPMQILSLLNVPTAKMRQLDFTEEQHRERLKFQYDQLRQQLDIAKMRESGLNNRHAISTALGYAGLNLRANLAMLDNYSRLLKMDSNNSSLVDIDKELHKAKLNEARARGAMESAIREKEKIDRDSFGIRNEYPEGYHRALREHEAAVAAVNYLDKLREEREKVERGGSAPAGAGARSGGFVAPELKIDPNRRFALDNGDTVTGAQLMTSYRNRVAEIMKTEPPGPERDRMLMELWQYVREKFPN